MNKILDQSSVANELLECAITSVKDVLQVPFQLAEPVSFQKHTIQSEMCVFVGFVGEMKGQLFLNATMQTFGGLGERMFGMALEGEMLQSFVGEMGNMIAGNFCTLAAQRGKEMNITPPSIFSGEMKLLYCDHGFSVPLEIQDIGEATLIFLIQEGQEE